VTRGPGYGLRAPGLAFAAVALLAAGCGSASARLREDDWNRTDRLQVKRIGIVVTSMPDGTPPAVAKLAERMAKRYMALRKESFVVLGTGNPAQSGAQGMLLLDLVKLDRDDASVDVQLWARLVRAKTQAEVWRCDTGVSHDWDDKDLELQRARYVKELGREVEPYVAPLFVALKRTLDELPAPVLNDADIEEKLLADE
jgi:probable lipoprotein (TIGR04455 family)